MLLQDIISELEQFAPLSFQESYDNAGLTIGNPSNEVSKALITLDVTEAVVQEAIDCGANLIIAHHPLIFNPIKKLNDSTETERCIRLAIKNDIAIYACHTNLDSVLHGVNAKICEKIGLQKCRFLSPKSDECPSKSGEGMIGELQEPIEAETFLRQIKQTFNCGVIRHTALCKKEIKTVAVCGGSGSFLINDAIQNNADIFITADIKYHDFFLADSKIILADIGHFESEQYTKEIFCELLKKKFYRFAFQISKVNTNPINYL